MSFPRYEDYKDSGVEWLGDVPEHWDVRRLKEVCEVFPSNVDKKTYENETPVLLCNYTDVYYNEKITPHIDFMAATASADQIKKFTLRGGDTIITKDSETADDIAIATYVPQDLPNVICGYHLSMIRPREATCGAFIKRLFDSIYVKSCCAVYANGLTRVGLGQYALDNLEMPFPPKTEQQTIATFLDRETAKIDALIAEQQRLIELLKEKRQSVISHAVTKGLNPNIPMKDSGIEWLGEVPEHWGTAPLKRWVLTRKGVAFKAEDFAIDGIRVVKASDIKNLTIRESEAYLPVGYLKQYPKAILNSGDIIISTVGSTPDVKNSAVGQIAKLPENLNGSLLNQNTVIFNTASEKLCNEFLFYSLLTRGYRDHLDLNAHGTANQASLNISDMLNFNVSIPNLDEQIEIVSYLDCEIEKFNNLTTEAKTAIILLQERRTALICAAVTGKIDVRGIAA